MKIKVYPDILGDMILKGKENRRRERKSAINKIQSRIEEAISDASKSTESTAVNNIREVVNDLKEYYDHDLILPYLEYLLGKIEGIEVLIEEFIYEIASFKTQQKLIRLKSQLHYAHKKNIELKEQRALRNHRKREYVQYLKKTEKCHIHNMSLSIARVLPEYIVYANPPESFEGYMKLKQDFFPHSNLTGMIDNEKELDTFGSFVLHCPGCLKARYDYYELRLLGYDYDLLNSELEKLKLNDAS